jgi:hypothetical protein
VTLASVAAASLPTEQFPHPAMKLVADGSHRLDYLSSGSSTGHSSRVTPGTTGH